MLTTRRQEPHSGSRTLFQLRLLQRTLTTPIQCHPTEQGFTLIELLVVIVILGILAAIALPAYLQQADKSKLNGAKTLATSAARECQVWQVDQDPTTFTLQTGGGGGVSLSQNGNCEVGTSNSVTYIATIVSGINAGKTCEVTVAPDGRITKGGDALGIGNIPGCVSSWN